MNAPLRAPYPYFGGKSKQAATIWRAFGHDVPNFVDAAFGSNAVLWGRPGGAGKIETINDIDGHVCNVQRAIKADPDAVAEFCDWPINELDLHARHRWLVDNAPRVRELLIGDPDAFDAKAAGWWIWGICQWIGGGWCAPNSIGRLLQKRPAVASAGGVHLVSPIARGLHGEAIAAKLEAQKEMTTRLPAIGNDRGINGVSAPPAKDWFRQLSARLRRVRVVCGDWRRVLGDGTLGKGDTVGGRRPCAVMLDPAYSHDHRDPALYAHDSSTMAVEMRQWAIEHGDDPELRICLAGYYEEHQAHLPATWTVHRWTGGRGYAAKDNTNREQETLWFSPACLPLESRQRELFGSP